MPEQFWGLTFFEFLNYDKAVTISEELEWQRTSLIAAIMINQNRPKGKKAISPDEINPYAKKINPKDAVQNALKLAEEMKDFQPRKKEAK